MVILGAGPAGLSAALWCAELGLRPLVLEASDAPGGQLLRIPGPVAALPGLPGIDGRTLLGTLLTLAAIGAALTLVALGAWLYKPMSKAWSNKRAADHPSENYFDMGKCVWGGGECRRWPAPCCW